MTTWIIDDNGNKASIECWGSEEAAREALKSLKDCSNCSNCSNIKNVTLVEAGQLVSARPPPTPVIENIHARIYEAASQPEAPQMRTWHTCENTHCRARWAVALAGPEGRALEKFYNTELAAMLIYDASDPNFKINPSRFYDSNEAALADMKRLAEAAS